MTNSKRRAIACAPMPKRSPKKKCLWRLSPLFSSKLERSMAGIDKELFFAPVADLNARLKAKEFSAEELTRAFSARLEQFGPRYNAVALLLPQEALRKAKDVDKEIQRGRLRGPLQGIPYGAKDLLSYKGQPTTWGAKPYAGQVFDFNATVIDKLDAVGSVLTGKLSM